MARLLPHFVIAASHVNKTVIHYDTLRRQSIKGLKGNFYVAFCSLMTFYPEFRNLFYYRIGQLSKVISFLCPAMNTLFIYTPKIGEGLFIQHGFATIISAESIGKNCWINQQVTIGYSNDTDCPTIQDNVFIYAGAKIIGKVNIGSNSKVGANSVFIKSVPENCTVVGVPAKIVRKDGHKITAEL